MTEKDKRPMPDDFEFKPLMEILDEDAITQKDLNEEFERIGNVRLGITYDDAALIYDNKLNALASKLDRILKLLESE